MNAEKQSVAKCGAACNALILHCGYYENSCWFYIPFGMQAIGIAVTSTNIKMDGCKFGLAFLGQFLGTMFGIVISNFVNVYVVMSVLPNMLWVLYYVGF